MKKNEHIIISDRLRLVPFTQNDASLFQELNNDPFVRKYMWDDEQIEIDTAHEIMAKNDQHFNDDQYGIWKIKLKTDDELIGYVGLWYFFEELQPQLIYALLERYTKKGFAKEASLAIINYAFNQLDFEYIVAATDEGHQASQKVAIKLGMSFVEKRIENGKPTLFYRIDRS